MRLASFLVSGAGGASANVSVVSFPGSGGDDLANINRWRNQVKLGPVSAAELAGQIQSLDAPAGTFVVADMAGTGPDNHATRILGAWLRQPDRVWFFKMMGSSDLVGSQKDAFISFLKSTAAVGGPVAGQPQSNLFNTNDLPVNPPVGAPVPAAPAATAEAGGMESSLPVQSEAGESLLWSAPAGWQVQTGNPVRKGSFAAGGGAEVAITAFPGDVGGVLANVNRWRQQAGLDPVDDAGLVQATAAIDSNGLHFVVVDATNGSAPILAALVPWNGGTWFFKLTGPAAAVAKARPDFLAFLRTVRAP
jgi:hypothetical protein